MCVVYYYIQPAAGAAVDTVAVVTVLNGCMESAESTVVVVVEQLVMVTLELMMEEPVEVLDRGTVKQDQQSPMWVEGVHLREYFPCFLSPASVWC